jgi:TRAP-type transport system periplasmic protein
LTGRGAAANIFKEAEADRDKACKKQAAAWVVGPASRRIWEVVMKAFLRPLSLVVAALAIGLAPGLRAEEAIKLRASLDTSATHGRTISIGDYLKQVQEASGGRIQTELFHSGQLFKDANVAKALRQGGIEMAVPGTWVLTGFVSDADIVQLPVFYGQSIDAVHRVTDGPVGQTINKELEEKLDAKVLGPWLDLGYQNVYSTSKPIADFKDLVGMKIRNSGGAGQFAKAKFFGATPNMTAWPDVPLALSQGTFDGLTTTNESIASAKLWDSGLKYGFETHEALNAYIPMVSQTFWKKLSPDLQKLMVDLWAKNIPIYRDHMAKAQTLARTTLMEHGIKFVDPTPGEIAAIRAKMMATQDALAVELKVSPDLVKQATAILTATN